MLLVDVFV